MKVAISSEGDNIDSEISGIFGRCPFFVIVDIDNNKMGQAEIIENSNAAQKGGAGISAAQTIADKGIQVLITGNVGPRALDVSNQFNIIIYLAKGKIKQALNDFIEGKLTEFDKK